MSTHISRIPVPIRCRELIRAGALVAVSHCGETTIATLLAARIPSHEDSAVADGFARPARGGSRSARRGRRAGYSGDAPTRMPLILARAASGKALSDSIHLNSCKVPISPFRS